MTDRPLRLHFVWIGQRFPYYCRLAVESALVAVPEAQVEIHVVGSPPCDRHFAAIARCRRVSVVAWTPVSMFRRCPLGPRPYSDLFSRIPDGAPTAVSNLLRLVVLHDRGGVYLDTDVVVLRGLHDPDRHGAHVGAELVWGRNRQRVTHGLGPGDVVRSLPWAARRVAARLDARLAHGRLALAERPTDRSMRLQVNNAVIAAPAGGEFTATALERALHVDPSVRFALGPSLLDDVVRERPDLVHVVPPSRFYAVPPGQSFRCFEDHHLRLPVDAQVLHYVASNHRRLLAHLDEHDHRFDHGRAPFWRTARQVRERIRKLEPVGR